MTERRLPTSVNQATTKGYDDPDLAFMERLRLYRNEKKSKGEFSRINKWTMRAIVILQIPTQIYVFLSYILPHFFVNWDPFVLYYAKVITTYLCVMALVNWFCVILVDTSYTQTRDSPYLRLSHHGDQTAEHFSGRIQEAASNNNEKNGQCVFDICTDGERLPWHYCDKCEMHVPYRVHHCKVCKTCITKRDHHCFIIGTCIGFKNERYFIVVTFLTIIVGIVGGCFTVNYIYSVIWADLPSVFDLVLPVTIIRYMAGYLSGLNCLIITHVYIEFLLGLVCLSFFVKEINQNVRGKTVYENEKKIHVRNTNTFNQNMRSVFGDFWALNFIFPMTIVLRQREDGITWNNIKLDTQRAK